MAEVTASQSADGRSDRRKLVAIMYADMVGYSRLIGLDDVQTLHRLKKLRQDVIDPAINEHGGRIVQTGGNSLLIVFDSIDGAVRCAVKLQQQVPIHDADQPPDRTIRFRIGINIGDAIADGTDLHGDAVNVAARIQTECPPGGICVTRAVRDHVHGRLDLSFEELGALRLKNIVRPVEAFVVRLDSTTLPKSVERSLMRGTGEALPHPDKPSIAVLAFDNMSGDPDQEFFSDGVADDIITELSRSRSLFVIARNSSFSYKGRPIDVRQIARELGVRYVLEGSVRRSGDRVRVSTQLIEAEVGSHIWADRYDRALKDVFAVQDEITCAIARLIGPAISQAEQQRAMRKPPDNLDAWEAFQRGLWHLTRGTTYDAEPMLRFFQRAIELDPQFAAARAMLGFAHIFLTNLGAPLPLPEALSVAEAEARRAIDLDPGEPSALVALAWVAFCNGDHDGALERSEQAISIEPNNPSAYLAKGIALGYSGRTSEAREAGRFALRLNPRDPSTATVRLLLTATHYFEGDYAGAVAAARSSIRDYPEYPVTYRYLAASLGQLGRIDEAGDALQHAITLSPATFNFFTQSRQQWFRPEDHERTLAGLRKAGWQG